MNKLRKH